MPTLAIIGTAGRAEDRLLLGEEHWSTMLRAARHLVKAERVDRVVSGGAAWADHVAVQLFLDRDVPRLTLHLPCRVKEGRFIDVPDARPVNRSGERPAEVMSKHHEHFSAATGVKSISDLSRASDNFACDTTVGCDFDSRNARVAEDADIALAMTFGAGHNVKRGGTYRTMRMILRKFGAEYARRTWHLDLNTMKLYRGASV
jgi:hypothetical protein